MVRCCVLVVALCLWGAGRAVPTLYKLNGNDNLETDLIPVSSTVIPIPIYELHEVKVARGNEKKEAAPDGPVTLITAYSKKS